MDPTSKPTDADTDGERANRDATAWESRLLALNALVDLAREHATGRSVPGDRSYRLEHAIGKLRQVVSAPDTHDRSTVDAAVNAFGETLASLNEKTGQRQ